MGFHQIIKKPLHFHFGQLSFCIFDFNQVNIAYQKKNKKALNEGVSDDDINENKRVS